MTIKSTNNKDNWSLVYDKYLPEEERLRETLCTLGNGYFATRGAFPEASADDHHYPGTYLAGGYNRLKTEIVGRVIENEDLVNMPNWLPLKFRIEEGEWFHLKAVAVLSFTQELDLMRGLLTRKVRFRDAYGKECTLEEARFVHMRHFHLAAVTRTLRAENWSGKIEVQSALDGRQQNLGVPRYRELNSDHLDLLDQGINENDHQYLKVMTNRSELRIAQAAKNKLLLNGEVIYPMAYPIVEEGYVAQHYQLDLNEGDEATIEKTVAMYTSRDQAISEAQNDAELAVSRTPDFSVLASEQAQTWKALWREFDIELETDFEPKNRTHAQLILRLHLFHLLQTVSINAMNLDVGVPARGWHGEAYRGHIFWDELFIFPTLNLRMPRMTQGLLNYRYRRLNEAREAAKASGFGGAMFPWQSGSSGREESQLVHLNPRSGRWISDYSYIQRHVNVAIAYNVWRFFEVTNDMNFLRSYGAEMLVEISRFLSSLCTYNPTLDRYEIFGVMGPDEYHDAYPDAKTPGLNNNSYMNVMTVWVLCRALELINILPEDHHRELSDLLELQNSEVHRWHDISKKMRVVFHEDGVLSQFEGYQQLKEFPWEEYQRTYGDIQRLDRILEAEGRSSNDYKVSKQADVLMLFYLFSSEELQEIFQRLDYPFSPDQIPKTIEYYLKRTSHGSTLSRIVHSWVLSRVDRFASWDLFIKALISDISDIQGGTTQEGIHLGSMAGTIDLVQRCYAGIEPKGDVLWFNPCLPDSLKRLRFHVHYQGHSIEIEITQTRLKVTAKYSVAKRIWIGFSGQTFALNAGEKQEFALDNKRQRASKPVQKEQ
ncbi:MAG: glycosyl hydrolase family 65 protein [Waddliaceae bacterium]